MAPSSQPPPRQGEDTQTAIPVYYRIPLLYIEPFLALGGAVLLLLSPRRFLAAVSPNPDLLSEETAALDGVRILTDMLAAMHVVFAFNTAVVLRCVKEDMRTWRLLCGGMLLSDAMHLAAAVREYGWAASFDVGAWRGSDWVNWVTLWGMAAVRLGVVLGVGLKACSGRENIVVKKGKK